MADLLERDAVEVEQEEEREWRDAGVRVLLAEVEEIIADHLSRGDAREAAIMQSLNGVPMDIVLLVADRLGVVSWRGAWRFRRRA